MHNLQTLTEAHKIYSHMYNDKNGTKIIWRNMINEKAIQAANFIWPIYLLVTVDILLLRLSLHFTQLHFTPLHYTCRHFTSSNLNFTQLHLTTLPFPLIWLNPISISYSSISLHITTLHLTSLQCTFRGFRHTSIPFISNTFYLLS
jgi:hypothetical protein